MNSSVTQTALDYFAERGIELAEELLEARADRGTYRALAQETLHALHAQTETNLRLTRELNRLRDEYRAVREQQMREAA